MLIYTCEQMRVIEENADVNGLSYVEMMENAGNACAEKIHSTVVGLNTAAKTVAVLCGSGKNGGDGFVIAKNLSDKGYGIRLVLRFLAITKPSPPFLPEPQSTATVFAAVFKPTTVE